MFSRILRMEMFRMFDSYLHDENSDQKRCCTYAEIPQQIIKSFAGKRTFSSRKGFFCFN